MVKAQIHNIRNAPVVHFEKSSRLPAILVNIICSTCFVLDILTLGSFQ